MFGFILNEETELRLVEPSDSQELFELLDFNRGHLRRWHPWVVAINSVAEAGKVIDAWQQSYRSHQAVFAGIRFHGRLCGMLNLHKLDWPNRWAAVSYWLDEAHQGQGIMTRCCRRMIAHCFDNWKLNRVTIECATENLRSRAVAERLGFRAEGIIREIEWLEDRFADHVMYGLLRADCANGLTSVNAVRPRANARLLHESPGQEFPDTRARR